MLLLFALAFAASTWALVVPRQDASTIDLGYVKLQASSTNSTLGYRKYSSIRYAAPPTGDLRFAVPQWPAYDDQVRNGTWTNTTGTAGCAKAEDCLFMDVYAPLDTSKTYPVGVFTYGGGFVAGSKVDGQPDGLYQQLPGGFVWVVFNYRLGITGFANGPSLTRNGTAEANVGLWDVAHAYEWVHAYIDRFNGDKNNVMAVGFSAGASQVLFSLTRFAGRSQQLFKRAFVMSPGYLPGAGHWQAEQFWRNVSTAVNCPDASVSCMRSVNFTTLYAAATSVAANNSYLIQPRVDGNFVADTYEAQLYAGRYNFTGDHEINSRPSPGVNSTADISTFLRSLFPSIADQAISEVVALYPESNYSSPGLRSADIRQSAELTAHSYALTEAMGGNTWNAEFGISPANHGSDQLYWFNGAATGLGSAASFATASNATAGIAAGAQPTNTTIATTMQRYLVSFLVTGDPNAQFSDQPRWPRYGSTGQVLGINTTGFQIIGDDLATNGSIWWNKALFY